MTMCGGVGFFAVGFFGIGLIAVGFFAIGFFVEVTTIGVAFFGVRTTGFTLEVFIAVDLDDKLRALNNDREDGFGVADLL